MKPTIDEWQKSCRTKETLTNLIGDVGSEVYNFDVSTVRTTNWSCLSLPPSPCAPRSGHASPSPVTYQNGACFKKYNYHLFSLRVSDSSRQLKRHVSSQFTSSLFPLQLRLLLNCSYQMHLQTEKLIITVPFRMYYLHVYFSHRSTCFCCSLR